MDYEVRLKLGFSSFLHLITDSCCSTLDCERWPELTLQQLWSDDADYARSKAEVSSSFGLDAPVILRHYDHKACHKAYRNRNRGHLVSAFPCLISKGRSPPMRHLSSDEIEERSLPRSSSKGQRKRMHGVHWRDNINIVPPSDALDELDRRLVVDSCASPLERWPQIELEELWLEAAEYERILEEAVAHSIQWRRVSTVAGQERPSSPSHQDGPAIEPSAQSVRFTLAPSPLPQAAPTGVTRRFAVGVAACISFAL